MALYAGVLPSLLDLVVVELGFCLGGNWWSCIVFSSGGHAMAYYYSTRVERVEGTKTEPFFLDLMPSNVRQQLSHFNLRQTKTKLGEEYGPPSPPSTLSTTHRHAHTHQSLRAR